MRFLSILVLFLSLSAGAVTEAPTSLILHRVVSVKNVNDSDQNYKVFREFTQAIPTNVYLIDTIYWHEFGPRLETIVMTRVKYDGTNLKAKFSFQSNDFPMDAQWDVHWSKDLVLRNNETFTHLSTILDRVYKVEITVLE